MRALVAVVLLVSCLLVPGRSNAMGPVDAARNVESSRSAPRIAFGAIIGLAFFCLLIRRRDVAVAEDARERR